MVHQRVLPAHLAGPGGRSAGASPTSSAGSKFLTRGVPLRPYEQAWADMRRLRTGYVPHLLAIADLLPIPLEPRRQPVP